MDQSACETYRKGVTDKVDENYKDLASHIGKLDNTIASNTVVLNFHKESFDKFSVSLEKVLTCLDSKANNTSLRLLATTIFACIVGMLSIFYNHTIYSAEIDSQAAQRDSEMALQLTRVEVQLGLNNN